MNTILLFLMMPFVLAQESSSISGQILNVNGSPAAGIRVSAAPVDADLSVLTAFSVTDSSGRYRIEKVESGTYFIIAGLIAEPTFYPGVAAQSGARSVQVARGASVTGLDFRIVTSVVPRRTPSGTPFGTVVAATFAPSPPRVLSASGTVVLKPGQQLPASLVLRQSTFSVVPITVRNDATFDAAGLQPGSYWFGSTLSVHSRPPDFVLTDKDITGLKVTVPVIGRLAGSVESRSGPLTQPVSLLLTDVANPAHRVAVSTATLFELVLPEGEYRVTTENSSSRYTIDSLTVAGTRVESGIVRVSEGATVRVVATVSPAASRTPPEQTSPVREIRGTIEKQAGSGGAALVGLRFSDALGPRATVVIDMGVTNAFSVGLPNGEYRVEVVLPELVRVKAMTYGASDILRITPGSSGEIRIALESSR